MEEAMFLASERAGVLEQLVQLLSTHKGKRKRQAEFNSLVRVLKGLKLIESASAVREIAWGCNRAGEIGLIVTFETPMRIIAQVPSAQGRELDAGQGEIL